MGIYTTVDEARHFDCICLLGSAKEMGLFYLLLDGDQKKSKIQQVTCTSMK